MGTENYVIIYFDMDYDGLFFNFRMMFICRDFPEIEIYYHEDGVANFRTVSGGERMTVKDASDIIDHNIVHCCNFDKEAICIVLRDEKLGLVCVAVDLTQFNPF